MGHLFLRLSPEHREGKSASMSPPESEAKILIAAFEKVDLEKTGKINITQLADIMRESAGDDSSGDEIEEMVNDKETMRMVFTMADIDGDNMVSLHELLIMAGCEGEEKERIAGFVRLADKGNKGYVTAEELKEVFQKMGQTTTDKDVKMFFTMADKDGDQKLQTEEVVNFFMNKDKNKDDPKEAAKMMFKITDLDSDGFIDKKELKKFFSSLADEEDEDDNMMVNMMMAMMDEDEDGKLNYEEFCAVMDQK